MVSEYKCPICSKPYKTLDEAIKCAKTDEEKEKINAKAKADQKYAESEIEQKYKELKVLVDRYNQRYPEDKYNIFYTKVSRVTRRDKRENRTLADVFSDFLKS